ncbi:hypothetical protein PABG_11978 [Paracoccidioides brasiliensis Pb03]|nr:hypothetical protein PABG_11978 [Paracoccidioides brasiliensis Pb03]
MTQGSQLQTHGQHNSLSAVNMKPNLQGWDKTHVSRGSLTKMAKREQRKSRFMKLFSSHKNIKQRKIFQKNKSHRMQDADQSQ